MPPESVIARRTAPVADNASELPTVAVPVRLAGGGSVVWLLETALRLVASCCASSSSCDWAAGSVWSRSVTSAPILPDVICDVTSTPFSMMPLKPPLL